MKWIFLTYKNAYSSFSYELRIESMLLKAEFDENMSHLERSVDDMLTGGDGKCGSLLSVHQFIIKLDIEFYTCETFILINF